MTMDLGGSSSGGLAPFHSRVGCALPRSQVVGLGWPNYWKQPWNKFDFVLCCSGLVDMIMTLSGGTGGVAFKVISNDFILREGWQPTDVPLVACSATPCFHIDACGR